MAHLQARSTKLLAKNGHLLADCACCGNDCPCPEDLPSTITIDFDYYLEENGVVYCDTHITFTASRAAVEDCACCFILGLPGYNSGCQDMLGRDIIFTFQAGYGLLPSPVDACGWGYGIGGTIDLSPTWDNGGGPDPLGNGPDFTRYIPVFDRTESITNLVIS